MECIYIESLLFIWRAWKRANLYKCVISLSGRHHPSVPRSKRLLTDDRSNILVYMTGKKGGVAGGGA